MALLEATTDMVAFDGELQDGRSRYVFEEALDWLRASKSDDLTVDLARVGAISRDIGTMLGAFAAELRNQGRRLEIVVSEVVRKELARAGQ
jgi:anti-anti-sigma regulatory factor